MRRRGRQGIGVLSLKMPASHPHPQVAYFQDEGKCLLSTSCRCSIEPRRQPLVVARAGVLVRAVVQSFFKRSRSNKTVCACGLCEKSKIVFELKLRPGTVFPLLWPWVVLNMASTFWLAVYPKAKLCLWRGVGAGRVYTNLQSSRTR